ncbi:MAG TPA: beta-ketoacyl-ACP reductase [Syntrophobacteraceae bacterium]|nr:beta-ketoacyl-ACP reductase [Syntrophobacteraceae bacterium]
MHIDLSDKSALVTGASRGIGRAIALELARAGARVLVHYHKSTQPAEDLAAEIIASGGQAHVFRADMSIPDEIEALFRYLGETFPGLDILVNNAGIIKDQLVPAMSLSDWDKVVNLNLRGAFLATRLAVERMLPRHAGKIINIASVSAIQGGRGQANYAAAKGGLVAFTRACAVELAPKGIQVNAVLPGMIVTDMSSRVRKRAGTELLQRIPIGRFGNPEDIAHLVVFLASPHADYLTGQAIAVDGGMSIA